MPDISCRVLMVPNLSVTLHFVSRENRCDYIPGKSHCKQLARTLLVFQITYFNIWTMRRTSATPGKFSNAIARARSRRGCQARPHEACIADEGEAHAAATIGVASLAPPTGSLHSSCAMAGWCRPRHGRLQYTPLVFPGPLLP